MRKLFAELRRVEAKASSLSRAQRFNLALYAFALVGLGLIALEVRQNDVSSREVRSLPGPVTTAPDRQPTVQPGDRRPVESTPGAPSPAGPLTEQETAGGPSAVTGREGERVPSPARSTNPGDVAPAPLPTLGQPTTPNPPASLAGGDVPFVVGGASGGVPGLSLIPQPPPAPALPPPSSNRSAAGVGGPSPADPVLADPPSPRFSGPAFEGLPGG